MFVTKEKTGDNLNSTCKVRSDNLVEVGPRRTYQVGVARGFIRLLFAVIYFNNEKGI